LVKLNSNYFNSFIISAVTSRQLPMIVKPRAIVTKGIYFYILYIRACGVVNNTIINNTIINDNVLNVLNLSENQIIKGKYDQRYKTEGSDLFIYNCIVLYCINYLNSIKI